MKARQRIIWRGCFVALANGLLSHGASLLLPAIQNSNSSQNKNARNSLHALHESRFVHFVLFCKKIITHAWVISHSLRKTAHSQALLLFLWWLGFTLDLTASASMKTTTGQNDTKAFHRWMATQMARLSDPNVVQILSLDQVQEYLGNFSQKKPTVFSHCHPHANHQRETIRLEVRTKQRS